MVLGRHGHVQLIVREAVPVGKPDTLARIRDAGGAIHVSSEIHSAAFAGDQIRLGLTSGLQLDCSLVIWLNEKRLRDNKVALIGQKITQAARARRKNP
jgi:hypothetical protein